MKYVLVLLVVVVVAWVMLGRRRGRGDKPGAPEKSATVGGAAPGAGQTPATQAMVACTHCGVHLPRADALADAQGRLFCDDQHRLAGPR